MGTYADAVRRKWDDAETARQFKIDALKTDLQNVQTPEQAQELLTGLVNTVQPHEQHHVFGALQGLIGRLGGKKQQPPTDPGMTFGPPPAAAPPAPLPQAGEPPIVQPGPGFAWPSSPAAPAQAAAPAAPVATPTAGATPAPGSRGPAPGSPVRPTPPGMAAAAPGGPVQPPAAARGAAPAPGGPKRPVPPVDPAIALFGKYWRSPEQLEQEKNVLARQASEEKTKEDLADTQTKVDWYNTQLEKNPNMTAQQKRVLDHFVGLTTTTRAQLKQYVSPDGKNFGWYDPTDPDSIPEGFTAVPQAGAKKPFKVLGKPYEYPKGSGKWFTSVQDDKEIKAQPMPDGFTPPPSGNKDDKMIAIMQKKALGQPLTGEDTAYLQAWDFFNKQTRVLPQIERAKAYGKYDKYIPVTDEDGNVTPMSIEEAEATHASLPASVGFQVRKAMDIAMTSGRIGDNLAVANTALQHLDLLDEAAGALGNGQVPIANQFKQRWDAAVMGSEAPTNFDMLRNSFAGEAARLFTGVGATQAEIAKVESDINNAESVDQLKGAIATARETINSRIYSQQARINAAQNLKPAFNVPGRTAAPPAPGGPKRAQPPGVGGGLKINRDAKGNIIGVE